MLQSSGPARSGFGLVGISSVMHSGRRTMDSAVNIRNNVRWGKLAAIFEVNV
jgi:hypothetical protein